MFLLLIKIRIASLQNMAQEQLKPLGWVLLLSLIVLFLLIPALITALGLLLLLAVLGAERLRSAVTLLNILLACVTCFTIILESPHVPVRPGLDTVALTATRI